MIPFLTYFLQLYFGLTPSFAHAFFNGLPALKSFFFAPYVSIVIWRPVLLLKRDVVNGVDTVNALAAASIAMKNRVMV